MAQVLGICRKCLYYTPKLPVKDQALITQIREGHVERPEYGQKRMALHLKINHKRTERVMKLHRIRPPRQRTKHHYCTVSTSQHPYTNLIQTIPHAVIGLNHIWVCDVSYFKFKGRFWYLVTIMDQATRQVLSAWVGKHHDAALVLQCLKQAIMMAGALPVYFHMDQGKEFMAEAVTHYLELQGVRISVSDKASPWQNGYQESFFGRFKAEFGDINRFETDGELIEEIYARIHYYNYDRIHTAIKMPPAIYAKQLSESLSRKRGTWQIHNYNGCFFVAEDNDKIIGYASGGPKITPYRYSRYFELDLLAVHPESQQKGIGEMLLNEITSWAKDQGYQKIYVESYFKNTPAINFYKKHGYQEIDISLEKQI